MRPEVNRLARYSILIKNMVSAYVTHKHQKILFVCLLVLTLYMCSIYLSKILVLEDLMSTSEKTNTTEVPTKRKYFMEMSDIKKTAMNIFFVESRCSTNKILMVYAENKAFVLNPRQSCAVESTAFTNPDRPVFVFHSCPLGDDFLQHSPPFATHLFSYPNVHVVRLNHTELFFGSPVQQLFQERLLENSSYPVEHSSDIIRLVLLWKFGGTYSDLDVVTIKSFKDLKTNWASEESQNLIANGVMNFEPSGEPHKILEEALEHINQHYDKAGWAANGPLVVTPFILRLCRVSTVPQAVMLCRNDFRVFSHQILLPLHYSRIKDMFDAKQGPQILSEVTRDSYSVHMYNKITRDINVTMGSTEAYVLLADSFCPHVYNNSGLKF